ncbi:MAG: histidine kinase [Thermaurantimonas sp.]
MINLLFSTCNSHLRSHDLPVLYQNFGIENGLYNSIINDVHYTSGNERYFASEGSGLIHFQKGNFLYYGTQEGLRMPFVSSIVEYNKDTLLVASVNEIYFFSKISKEFVIFSEIPASENIRKMYVQKNNLHVYSNIGNIYRINLKSNIRKAFLLQLHSVNQIIRLSDFIYALSEDSVIYRIHENGIEKYFSNGEKIHKIGCQEGYLVIIQSDKIIRSGPFTHNIIHLNSSISSITSITFNTQYLLTRISEDRLLVLYANGRIHYLTIPSTSNRFFLLDNGELWISFPTVLKCYLFPSVSTYIEYNFSDISKIYDKCKNSDELNFSTGKDICSINLSKKKLNKIHFEGPLGLILQIKSLSKDTIILNTETGIYLMTNKILKPLLGKGNQAYTGDIDVHPLGFISIPSKENLILKKGSYTIVYPFKHLILWHHWIDTSTLCIQSESRLHICKTQYNELKEIRSFDLAENAMLHVDYSSGKIWSFNDGYIANFDTIREIRNIQIDFKRDNIINISPIGKDSLIAISDQMYLIYLHEDSIRKQKIRYSDWILKRFSVFDLFSHNANNYFITNEGILEVSKEFLVREKKPNIFITNVFVNGVHRYLPKDNLLKNTDNTVHIFFSVTSDIFSEKEFRYRYIISSGKRKTDTVDSSSPELYLSNLNPDTYLIKYELLSSDQKMIDYGQLHFTISRPFWQNIWFIFLVFSGLYGGSLYIIRWRTRQIREKIRLKELLLETETKALRLQMNPHFLYNSLESIEGFILKSDKLSAIKHLNNFTRLMRMILEGSDKGVHSLRREKDLLKYYLELENMRSGNQFDFRIEIYPESVDEDGLLIPSMMIQPHVENSIIHGVRPLKDRRGLIRVSFYVHEDEQKIEVLVEDNGVGRSKSSELSVKNDVKSKSLALQINAQRLKMMSQTHKNSFFVSIEDVFDEYGLPSGTRVKIHMPILKKIYPA